MACDLPRDLPREGGPVTEKKEKRKRGGQELPEHERRDYTLRVRMNAEERAEMDAAVAATGKSAAELVRAMFKREAGR